MVKARQYRLRWKTMDGIVKVLTVVEMPHANIEMTNYEK